LVIETASFKLGYNWNRLQIGRVSFRYAYIINIWENYTTQIKFGTIETISFKFG